MGQDEVAKLISKDKESQVPLPTAIAEELRFGLGVRGGPRIGAAHLPARSCAVRQRVSRGAQWLNLIFKP